MGVFKANSFFFLMFSPAYNFQKDLLIKKTNFDLTVTKWAVAHESADLTFNLDSTTNKLHDVRHSPSQAQFFFFFFFIFQVSNR